MKRETKGQIRAATAAAPGMGIFGRLSSSSGVSDFYPRVSQKSLFSSSVFHFHINPMDPSSPRSCHSTSFTAIDFRLSYAIAKLARSSSRHHRQCFFLTPVLLGSNPVKPHRFSRRAHLPVDACGPFARLSRRSEASNCLPVLSQSFRIRSFPALLGAFLRKQTMLVRS